MSKTKKTSITKTLAKTIDGGLAGITGCTATFPLDLAKTRLQTAASKEYTNLYSTIKIIHKNEGFSALYSGYKVNVSFIVFEKALKLVANDLFRERLTNKNTGKISLFSECVAGAGAGFVQSVVTTPMELLKIQGQMDSKKSSSTIQTMQKLLKNEGIRGFYRGWCSTLARDLPFSFVYFPLYANLKETKFFGKGQSFWGNLFSGMISGVVSGAVVTPFDVVKTRLQNIEKGSNSNSKIESISWFRCAGEIYKKEGSKAFLYGVGPRMICIGALMAVAQGFYELGIGERILS